MQIKLQFDHEIAKGIPDLLVGLVASIDETMEQIERNVYKRERGNQPCLWLLPSG